MTVIETLESCNDPPTSAQERSLEPKRSQLDAAISKVDKEIAKLQAKRTALEAERQRYARAFSSLRRLPNEIFVDILAKLDKQSLLRMTKVCRRWRGIALGSPSLWTDLVLPAIDYRSGGSSNDTKRVKAHVRHYARHHIQHSGGLFMSLTVPDISSYLVQTLAKEMHRTFPTLSARWRAISIASDVASDIHTFLRYYDRYPDQVEYLETLALTAKEMLFDDSDDSDDDDDDSDDSKTGPVTELDLTHFTGIRNLQINFEEPPFSEKLVQANWTKLTSLTIASEITSQEYLELLLQCKALESLNINPEGDYHGPAPGPLVTLSRLRSLTLISLDQPSTLLNRLSTPILEVLAFHFVPNFEEREEDGSLTHFLDRVLQGHLRSMLCTGEVLLSKRLHRRHLRDVTTLRVIAPYEELDDWDSNLFDFLVHKPSMPLDDQIRHLEYVKVDGHPPLTLSATTSCAKLLRSRCVMDDTKTQTEESPAILRRVVLIENYEDVLNGRKELEKFCEKGILDHRCVDGELAS